MKKEAIKKEIAKVVSQKAGLDIQSSNVHVNVKRFYYIQELKPGYAYLLEHYQGPLIVEISQKDWDDLENDELSVTQFVNKTQWLYGYFLGQGSMINGGYYTPLEKEPGINQKDLISKVMTSISKWLAFQVFRTPLSDTEVEEWKRIQAEYLNDPRVDYFNKVDKMVHTKYGYNLRGMLCDDSFADDEIRLVNNSSSRTFELVISEENIWNLLVGKKIAAPEEMKVFLWKTYSSKSMQVKTSEEFINALFCLEITRDWEEQEAIRSACSTKHSPAADVEDSLLFRIVKMLKKQE